MSVKERIIEFIKYRKLSQSSFEKTVGLSNGYVNNIRKSISDTVLQKIALAFEDLNPTWLRMGEGNMLREPKPWNTPGVLEDSAECYDIKNRPIEEKEKIISILWGKLEEKDKMIADLVAQLKEKDKEPCPVCAQKDKEIENLKKLAWKQVAEWGAICRDQAGIGKKKKSAG